jgi:hypothetical protein
MYRWAVRMPNDKFAFIQAVFRSDADGLDATLAELAAEGHVVEADLRP